MNTFTDIMDRYWDAVSAAERRLFYSEPGESFNYQAREMERADLINAARHRLREELKGLLAK